MTQKRAALLNDLLAAPFQPTSSPVTHRAIDAHHGRSTIIDTVDKSSSAAICMRTCLLDVILHDVVCQTVRTRVVPVTRNSRVRDVCVLLAATFKIYNADEFALFRLDAEGGERRLRDDEKLFYLRDDERETAPNVKFVFKHKATSITWPV